MEAKIQIAVTEALRNQGKQAQDAKVLEQKVNKYLSAIAAKAAMKKEIIAAIKKYLSPITPQSMALEVKMVVGKHRLNLQATNRSLR